MHNSMYNSLSQVLNSLFCYIILFFDAMLFAWFFGRVYECYTSYWPDLVALILVNVMTRGNWSPLVKHQIMKLNCSYM